MKIEKGIALNTYIEIESQVVEVRAYYYWENAGRPEGRSEEFYYQALNDLFEETTIKIANSISNTDEDELINWQAEIRNDDEDSTWYEDIELLLPEIKQHNFRNVGHKISWLFNSLKNIKNPKTVVSRKVEDENITVVIDEDLTPQEVTTPIEEISVAKINNHLDLPPAKLSDNQLNDLYAVDQFAPVPLIPIGV